MRTAFGMKRHLIFKRHKNFDGYLANEKEKWAAKPEYWR